MKNAIYIHTYVQAFYLHNECMRNTRVRAHTRGINIINATRGENCIVAEFFSQNTKRLIGQGAARSKVDSPYNCA